MHELLGLPPNMHVGLPIQLHCCRKHCKACAKLVCARATLAIMSSFSRLPLACSERFAEDLDCCQSQHPAMAPGTPHLWPSHPAICLAQSHSFGEGRLYSKLPRTIALGLRTLAATPCVASYGAADTPQLLTLPLCYPWYKDREPCTKLPNTPLSPPCPGPQLASPPLPTQPALP